MTEDSDDRLRVVRSLYVFQSAMKIPHISVGDFAHPPIAPKAIAKQNGASMHRCAEMQGCEAGFMRTSGNKMNAGIVP